MTPTNRKNDLPADDFCSSSSLEDVALVLSGSDVGWDEAESLFSIRVEAVEEQFYAGELSAVEAASQLEMSLEEFVAEFVLNEEWYEVRGARTQQERQNLVRDVASSLRQEAVGISVRDFAFEVLSQLLGISGERLLRVTEGLAERPLGQAWLDAHTIGGSLANFFACEVLPDRIRVDLDIDPTLWQRVLDESVDIFKAREEYLLNSSWFAALEPFCSPALDGLLARLEKALIARRIENASTLMSRLDSGRRLVRVGSPRAPRLLWCYAQWIHFDRGYLPRVEGVLAELQRIPREDMCPSDRARISLAEGVALIFRERYDHANACLRIAEREASAIFDAPALLVSSLYYQSKIEEIRGRFTPALTLLDRAEAVGERSLPDAAKGRLSLRRGWLHFLGKDYDAARVSLTKAKELLKGSSDHLSIGDLLSFEGRLCRKEERLQVALSLFVKALGAYCRHDSLHPDVARTHINLGATLRLMVEHSPASGARISHLRRALWHLERAEHIIRNAGASNQRLLAKVYVARSKVHWDAGEQYASEVAAREALTLSVGLGDKALLAETRRLQAVVCGDAERVAILQAEAALLASQTDDRHLHSRIDAMERTSRSCGDPK
jgi:tetratricopeptide (TPR) repeat protein